MIRALPLLIALLVALPLAAQDAKPAEADLAELWRVGSQWQVGDNVEPVNVARKKLIDAGDDGLKFALTKLDITDTHQIRCLQVVIRGFGDKAVKPLTDRVGAESEHARRNVAELLTMLDARDSADALLAQIVQEKALGPKLAQAAALAKWQVSAVVPTLVELSHSETQRVRHRVTTLLAYFEDEDAVARLVAMLDDTTYYVRVGAQEALKAAPPTVRARCLGMLRTELEQDAASQDTGRLRRLLPVVATIAHADTPLLLLKALGHAQGAVRGDAASALAAWKAGAGLLDKTHDISAALKRAHDAETDPFAKAELAKALQSVTGK